MDELFKVWEELDNLCYYTKEEMEELNQLLLSQEQDDDRSFGN